MPLGEKSDLVCLLIAVDAAAVLVELLDTAFGAADTMRILANEARVGHTVATAAVVNTLRAEEHQNECHSDVSAALRLLKVSGARIIVNVNGDLGYTGKGVENAEALLCTFQVGARELVAVLQSLVLVLIGESLCLYSRHI